MPHDCAASRTPPSDVQCQGAVSGPAEEEEAARHQEDLRLYRLLRPLLFTLCGNKASSASIHFFFHFTLRTPAQLTSPRSSLLQVAGVAALRAHPPLLGRDQQVSDLRQNLHGRLRVLSPAAAVPESAGSHHPPSPEEEPVPAVGLQHQQHAGHHGRQLRPQSHLTSKAGSTPRGEVRGQPLLTPVKRQRGKVCARASRRAFWEAPAPNSGEPAPD